jgi:hypothetical protein
MELTFNFKQVKEEQLEKYPDLPVLTYVGGNKTAKFALNKKACEILGYTDSITATINYAKINETDDLVLVNTNGTVAENRSNITLNKEFANSKFFDRLNKHFGSELKEGDELLLAVPTYEFPYKVVIVTDESPNSMTIDDFSQFEDSAFEDLGQQVDESYDEEDPLYDAQKFGNIIQL